MSKEEIASVKNSIAELKIQSKDDVSSDAVRFVLEKAKNVPKSTSVDTFIQF